MAKLLMLSPDGTVREKPVASMWERDFDPDQLSEEGIYAKVGTLHNPQNSGEATFVSLSADGSVEEKWVSDWNSISPESRTCRFDSVADWLKARKR